MTLQLVSAILYLNLLIMLVLGLVGCEWLLCPLAF